ncbi:MAG: flippase-like domain-containing protein [Magnetococcales bacterium]|nr:flippase-like domain-containing protein [Magnetococcales bacterium]MBF0420349.1 flippase-like domain-containing protein [Magnetococcales bacterium]
MKNFLPRWLFPVVKLLVAGAVMFWLFKSGKLNWGLILEGTLAPMVIAIGVLCNITLVSSSAVRWYLLLKGQGVSLPLHFAHNLTYITVFFNNFIPGGIGGDALRIAFVLKRSGSHRGKTVLTIIMDRFLGLYSMLLIAGTSSILYFDQVKASPPLLLLAYSTLSLVGAAPPITIFVLWLMRRTHHLPDWIKGNTGSQLNKVFLLVEQFAHYFHSRKKYVFAAILISLMGQCIAVGSFLWIAFNLSIHFPEHNFFLATPWSWIANILPVSPGGLGVGEAAFDQICQWLMPDQIAASFGTVFLINRLFTILATLPGLMMFFLRDRFLPAPHPAQP